MTKHNFHSNKTLRAEKTVRRHTHKHGNQKNRKNNNFKQNTKKKKKTKTDYLREQKL